MRKTTWKWDLDYVQLCVRVDEINGKVRVSHYALDAAQARSWTQRDLDSLRALLALVWYGANGIGVTASGGTLSRMVDEIVTRDTTVGIAYSREAGVLEALSDTLSRLRSSES